MQNCKVAAVDAVEDADEAGCQVAQKSGATSVVLGLVSQTYHLDQWHDAQRPI